MVEATPKQSSKKSTQALQSTPESEKPRVQLELSSSTSPPNAGAAAESGKAGGNDHLDLLKQTVAHLEGSGGVENETASAAMVQNVNGGSAVVAETTEARVNQVQNFDQTYQ